MVGKLDESTSNNSEEDLFSRPPLAVCLSTFSRRQGPQRADALFLHGDDKGRSPADLRTLGNKEPVAVTDNLDGDFWYLIDGSHCYIAQVRSGKPFQDVRIDVCVHPRIMEWSCIPSYYKQSR